MKDWIDGALKHPTKIPEKVLPPLPENRISQIPGALAAMGNTSRLTWQVCNLIDGTLRITDQIVSNLEMAGTQFQQELTALQKVHKDNYEKMLTTVPALAGSQNQGAPAPIADLDPVGAPEDPQPVETTLQEFESEAAFKEAKGGLLHSVVSPIVGVTILVGKDGSKALISSKDITLPKHSQLGGIGGASLKLATGETDGIVQYGFPDGARALHQPMRFATHLV
jgi:hypothetical protein